MTFQFGALSERRLQGVHPDLVRVMRLALSRSTVDFSIIEGLRTKQRQAELVASGASWTMNSRHLTGHAVDVAPYVGGKIRWDWPLYDRMAPTIKDAAKDLGIPVEWGGDWRGKKRDGPHWQLPWKAYQK